MESKHEIPDDLKATYQEAKDCSCCECEAKRPLIERIASLEAALAEARSQIGKWKVEYERVDGTNQALASECSDLRAQLADYGKPVTEERSRTQSRQPMSERSAEE